MLLLLTVKQVLVIIHMSVIIIHMSVIMILAAFIINKMLIIAFRCFENFSAFTFEICPSIFYKLLSNRAIKGIISGKYRTILYIGILYGIGQAILAVGALSIGEKKHMEPVRIMMVMLMASAIFEACID